jgi:hypothetical protein
MAASVTTGVIALLLEKHRGLTGAELSPNEVKAILQFTSLDVAGHDVLTRGAGAINADGALALVATRSPAGREGRPRTSHSADPVTTIESETYLWNQAVIWGNAVVWGNSIDASEPAWALAVVWGSAVVWGNMWIESSASDAVWSLADIWVPQAIATVTYPSEEGQPPDATAELRHITADAVVWGNVATGF